MVQPPNLTKNVIKSEFRITPPQHSLNRLDSHRDRNLISPIRTLVDPANV